MSSGEAQSSTQGASTASTSKSKGKNGEVASDGSNAYEADGASDAKFELKGKAKRTKQSVKKRPIQKPAPNVTSLTLSTPADLVSVDSLELNTLAIKLNNSTPILNRFVEFTQNHNVHTDTLLV